MPVMSFLYQLMDNLLPFEWASHMFMKNALIGVLLITPVLGLLGTMIVSNRMAFFSDALGHSALTGIAIGVIIGISKPLWSMLFFSIILSIVILIVKNANTASMDTVIGVFSSTAVALGVVILSIHGGFSKYSVYLIGDLLSISPTDLLLLVLAFIAVISFWYLSFNKLLIVSINHSLARSRGIKVQVYEFIFTIIVAVVVTISIQWVGILIISSLLVLPAAAARNISQNMRQYHVWSVSIALISGLSGLILSYFLGTATGATIVLITAIFFTITFFIKIKIRN